MQVAEAAVVQMEKQVEILPKDARLRVQLATAYRTQGDFESAMRTIKEAQALSPLKQSLILEEGIIALQAQDYEAARAAFMRAYELDTSFDDLAYYAAAGDILAGDKAAAQALLVERFGTTTVDSNIVVLAYYERQDYAEVIPLLRDRMRREPLNETPYLQLSSVYAESGRIEEAREVLRALIEVRPETASQVMQLIEQLGT